MQTIELTPEQSELLAGRMYLAKLANLPVVADGDKVVLEHVHRAHRRLATVSASLDKIDLLPPSEYMAWRMDNMADMVIRHGYNIIRKSEKTADTWARRAAEDQEGKELFLGDLCYPVPSTKTMTRIADRLERLLSIVEKDEVAALGDISTLRAEHKQMALEIIVEINQTLAKLAASKDQTTIDEINKSGASA